MKLLFNRIIDFIKRATLLDRLAITQEIRILTAFPLKDVIYFCFMPRTKEYFHV